MKATVTTKRAFLVDLEPGDVVKVRSRCYVLSRVEAIPDTHGVRIYANLIGGELSVFEKDWYTPMTCYVRKETS